MTFKQSQKFSFVVIGRILSSGLLAVFYLTFATILDPDVYGNLSYLIAIAGMVSIFSRFGLNHSIVVYKAKENSLLVNQVNVLAIILISIASIFLLFFNVYAAVLCFSLSIVIMYTQNLLGQKDYQKYMIIHAAKGGLIIILPIVFYTFLELPGVLVGISLGYFIFGIPFFKFLKFDKNIFNLLKTNYKTLIHNFGVDASTNLVRFADKFLIGFLMGYTSLGIYQLHIQILYGLEILPLALHSFLLSEESSRKKHNKIGFLVIISSILVVIIVIFFGPYFIEQFLPKYSAGNESLQILIISLIPLSISAILNAKLQAKESTKVGYSAFVRIGSMLALIAVLGPMFGLVGLAYSILMSVVFHVIFLSVIYYKTIPSMKET